MFNVKEFWRGVRQEASILDPEAAQADAREYQEVERVHLKLSKKQIWLVSVTRAELNSFGGQVISAPPMIAGQYLREGTHVLATEEQVAAHQAELARRKEVIEREEADRKGVPTSKLLESLTATLAATMQQNALVAAASNPHPKPRG